MCLYMEIRYLFFQTLTIVVTGLGLIGGGLSRS